MTAEIAIGNRQAIALAADSAVTVGKERVWKHSNKLFSLGPVNDVAIMIYNTGEFAGFPWELIVKKFRAEIGNTTFDTVSECAKAFMSYLDDPRYQPDTLNQFISLSAIVDPISVIAEQVSSVKGTADYLEAVIAACERHKAELSELPKLEDAPPITAFQSYT